MQWLDVALTAAHAIAFAGMLSLGGAIFFRLAVAPFALERVTWPSLAVALIGAVLWLPLQSAALAGATDLGDTLAAVPVVLGQTWFGQIFVVRLALLLLAAALAGFAASPARLVLAAACAASTVALQAAIGHAYADGNTLLMASVALHVLAVAAWLGGLLPLWLALRAPSPGHVARRFSLWAMLAVAVIVATGLEQGAVLIGGWSGLFDTTYGRIALLKIVLLLALLCIAAANQFVFTPALDRAPSDRRRLRASLAVEIALGICVVSAAAALASQAPATDMSGMDMNSMDMN